MHFAAIFQPCNFSKHVKTLTTLVHPYYLVSIKPYRHRKFIFFFSEDQDRILISVMFESFQSSLETRNGKYLLDVLELSM